MGLNYILPPHHQNASRRATAETLAKNKRIVDGIDGDDGDDDGDATPNCPNAPNAPNSPNYKGQRPTTNLSR